MEGAVAFRIAVTVIRRSGGWSDGRGEHRNALSTKELIIGVAVLAGVLSTLAVAAPAQAAPNVVAYYQGYQYGWARIAPESYWNPNDIIGLEINDHGNGWELTHLTINDGSSWENTAAQIAQASTGYQFRAALFRSGQRVDHTDPW